MTCSIIVGVLERGCEMLLSFSPYLSWKDYLATIFKIYHKFCKIKRLNILQHFLFFFQFLKTLFQITVLKLWFQLVSFIYLLHSMCCRSIIIFFFNVVLLLYIMLVSTVQQNEPALCTHISPLFLGFLPIWVTQRTEQSSLTYM